MPLFSAVPPERASTEMATYQAVRHGDSAPPPSCSIWSPVTGGRVAESRMIPDGEGGYHASLTAAPGTWRIAVEAVAERPVVRVEDLVTVVAG